MMKSKYDDMISMPHHVSRNHPHMSNYDRAAQFSPFAALTGHDDAVKETARLTDRRIELDENEKMLLDEKLHMAIALGKLDVEITFFCPDSLKEGGAYEVKKGRIRKIDEYRHLIIMDDRGEIAIDDILDMEIL